MNLNLFLPVNLVVEQTGERELNIDSISYDSRRAKPDSLFVAIRGTKTDGNNYIEAARDSGSIVFATEDPSAYHRYKNVFEAAILASDIRLFLAAASAAFFGNPFRKLKLVGVTGTNGKTTITRLIYDVLRRLNVKSGVIGTIGCEVDGRYCEINNTTPESIDLNEIIDDMSESGVEVCSCEVSSHSIHFDRIAFIEFSLVVFTNLTQDHLDFHSSMDDYFKCKSSIFFDKDRFKVKRSLINIDDDYGRKIFESLKGNAYSFSLSGKADFRADNVSFDEKGFHATFNIAGRRFNVNSRLKGKFNIYNVLAAVASLYLLDYDPELVCENIRSADYIPGRFEPIETDRGFMVVVDYAHTPDGLLNAINAAKSIAKGRVITVFGCGGNRDRLKRPIMGRISGELSDYTILTSDNPRYEVPEDIVREIEEGIRKVTRNYISVVDRRLAIAEALKIARDGDIILIAGKGHEKMQQIKDKLLPFDDKLVTAEELTKIGANEERT
ncbi:MAG: UDP-N-acetylmuramoyl-L-alanyl-D-glutamate--2,6-diaminopimelate ligase [Actinobacteria bacterium]|nr:UDP-N-acetylmuramoyl-L-alanyl-D-glutamate--2,6-diaminopimelate ligase [Actinomycetota bacterium]